MPRKKGTSISLDTKQLAKASNKINTLFSGNKSAYINFLIAKDNEGIVEEKGEAAPPPPPPEKTISDEKMNIVDGWED